MLATIVPYFLLASISDKSVWPNGPEFKFDSNVEIRIKGLNGTNIENGFNITNEFTCRPKTDTSLRCQFQNKKLFIFDENTETGEIKNKDETNSDSRVFPPFPFEIAFDKNGANKIILNETLSKHEEMLDIAKAMASALNVATDFSGFKLSGNPVALGQVHNIVLSKCKGDVVANMKPSSEEDSSKDADWNLELSPPLEKLAGRNLNLMKTWSMTDCKAINKYFWLGMFVALGTENPQKDEVIVDLKKINDRITVSQGSFDYQSVINMNVTVIKSIPDKKELEIQESSEIHLSGVQPAVEAWPEIDNAVTIDLNEKN